MPHYRFRLEGNTLAPSELAYDLMDQSLVGYVAKQAARYMASRELAAGHLHLARNMVVLDADNAEVARYPLSAFLSLE